MSGSPPDNTDEATLTPGTLVDGARMYAAAADTVNDRFPNALHVLSHLLGMSIELALKAFLRHKGTSASDLRLLGHDLSALLGACEWAGLERTGSRHFRLGVLGLNYKRRTFAYPQEGILRVISPWSLREITREIVEEVFSAVHGSEHFAEMSGEPGLFVASKYPEDYDASAWAMPPGSKPNAEDDD